MADNIKIEFVGEIIGIDNLNIKNCDVIYINWQYKTGKCYKLQCYKLPM